MVDKIHRFIDENDALWVNIIAIILACIGPGLWYLLYLARDGVMNWKINTFLFFFCIACLFMSLGLKFLFYIDAGSSQRRPKPLP